METTPHDNYFSENIANWSGNFLNTTVFNTQNIEMRELDILDFAEMFGLLLIALFGIPGNFILVLVQLKLQDITSTDYLIANLALFDLFDSLINVPMALVVIASRRSYLSHTTCKLLGILGFWCSISSAVFIGMLSIDRYILTCKPLQRKYTKRTSKIICIILSLAALMFSVPVYLSLTYDARIKNCSFEGEFSLYFLILVVFILSEYVVITVLYAKIALMLRKRIKKQVGKTKAHQGMSTSVILSTNSIESTISWDDYRSANAKQPNSVFGVKDTGGNNDDQGLSQSEHNMSKDTFKGGKSSGTKQHSTNRATKILFLISIIYLLSWSVGSVSILAYNQIHRAFDQLLHLVRRTNNISNPILFVCISSKFRENAKRILLGRKGAKYQ